MSAPAPQIGERLGKYRLERLLGRGAMGSVYLATDTVLGRLVALKVIAAIYAGDPTFKARFLREARTLAMINHPHVVQIYDVHEAGQRDVEAAGADLGQIPFLVTEYVEGCDLHSILQQEGPLPWRRAALLARQTALGLGAAAARDIVHRDVKPGNILVADDLVKVTDFGLAKPLIGDHSLTQAEVVMGTPDYMAPEQAMGQIINWRADLYALGCTLFQMLTGRTPYGQGSPQEICTCHIYEPFPKISSHDQSLPTGLVELLERLCQKDPTKRPGSYDDVVATIERVLGPTRESGISRCFVVVERGRQLGLRLQIGERPLIVGRLPDCDLAIDDARASRKHAAFQHGPSGVEARDLGSRNGIFVNGQQVSSAVLNDGDRIVVGDTVLRFEVPAPPPPSSARRVNDGADPFGTPAAERSDRDEVTEVRAIDLIGAVPSGVEVNAPPASALLARVVSASAAGLITDAASDDVAGLNQASLVDAVVLRFNLTGAVRLLELMEPARAAERLNRCLHALVDVVFEHRGSIEDLTPDAVLAVFGAPLQVPDPAGKAASAAIEGVAVVLEGQRLEPVERRVQVRAGVAAGEVLAGIWGPPRRQDFSVTGLPVDKARSLGALAPPGGVLICQEVQDRIGEHRASVQRHDLTLRLHGRELAVYELQAQRLRPPTP